MGSRGPKPITINWEEFDKLASYQCTQEEIAAFFDVDVTTLENICERDLGEKLSVLWQKRKFTGRVKLRKLQMAMIEKGGSGASTMAIYLDKKMFPEERFSDKPPEIPPPQALPIETKNDIKTFLQFCDDANYFTPFPKQVEMMIFATQETDTRLLLGARGYGKTDYCTIMGLAYDVYLAFKKGLPLDEYTNLIITKSGSRCSAIIYEIASALEKNGVELEKSTSKIIRVKGLVGQDHSFEAITIKTSMRGRHPKRITMDDPVTDEDTSEAMRTLVKKKYDESYKLCKNIIIIGQPAHAHDLYALLRGIVKVMEVPHGTIPELDADLDAMMKAGIDKDSIEMSYHLRVPVSGTSPFSKINYVDKYPMGDSVAFIDPSDGGDYTAVSIMKSHFSGLAVVGKIWKKAWYHCEDEMVKFLADFKVGKVCFETNMTGTQPIGQLRALLKTHGIGVVGKHSDSNKHACIMSAGSYANLIHLSKESDRAYIDQVVQYEYGAKFDDAPDSLARCMEWIGLIKGKK